MNYSMPKKGEAVVCKECRNSQPHIYNTCEKPCNWFVSWVMHEVSAEVTKHLRTWECEHRMEPSTFGKIQFLTCVHCGRQLMRSDEDEEWTVIVGEM